MSKNELVEQQLDENKRRGIKMNDIRDRIIDRIIEDNKFLAIGIIVYVVYMFVALIYQ
ncbi:MAG: hypothetical protein ABF276_08745 [Sulfurovum sp.]